MGTYNSDGYYFEHVDLQIGMGRIKVSKKEVWDAIINDPDFRKLRLFKIRVEEITHGSSGFTNGVGWGSYTWPGWKTYNTRWYWCKNVTEARKIGQVLEEVTTAVKKYPEPKKRPRKNATTKPTYKEEK